ncbi:hypothetical protein DFH28DRAFT_1103612 [Melampsora americana]|nr:hypothetical protein DFH28DRAFT_1103612 [Melampsora americana]
MGCLWLLILIFIILYKEISGIQQTSKVMGSCTRHYFWDYAREPSRLAFEEPIKLKPDDSSVSPIKLDFGYLDTRDLYHQNTRIYSDLQQKSPTYCKGLVNHENILLDKSHVDTNVEMHFKGRENSSADPITQSFISPYSQVNWYRRHGKENNKNQKVHLVNKRFKLPEATSNTVPASNSEVALKGMPGDIRDHQYTTIDFTRHSTCHSDPQGHSVTENLGNRETKTSLDTQVQEDCIVHVHKRKGVSPFQDLDCSEALEKLNEVLIKMTPPLEGEQIRALDITFLDSGTVKVKLNSLVATSWLRKNIERWGPMVNPNYRMPQGLHKIVLTNLPNLTNRSRKAILKNLCDSNHLNPRDINELRYSKDSSGRSMILITSNEALVDMIEDKGLVLDGSRIRGQIYNPAAVQCEKCLQMGHHHTWCRLAPLCEGCGQSHWSHKCDRGIQELKNKLCYVCIGKHHSSSLTGSIDYSDTGYHHSAYSGTCPTKLNSIERFDQMERAYQQAMLNVKEGYERQMLSRASPERDHWYGIGSR